MGKGQPRLADGTGIRADDDFQRTVVYLDSLQNARGQLLRRGGRVAAVGDLTAPALNINFPGIKPGDASSNGAIQGRLAGNRDGLRGRKP